jgi:hypothetical protein
MSWQRTVLSVVIAASGSLCGCVLQGERHEDRLRDEICALAEQAAESCGDAVIYDPPEVTELGKELEPAPTIVKSTEQAGADCVSGQIRLQNLCGPEIAALNACVLDNIDTSVVAEHTLPEDASRDVLRFGCVEEQAEFYDPGQRDNSGNPITVRRYAQTGEVMVISRGFNYHCGAERLDVINCAGGR